MAAMPMLINKTGQGSFSDPWGNMLSTACVHMAKLSPLHAPTQHGFIHNAYREELLAHIHSQTWTRDREHRAKPRQKAQQQLQCLSQHLGPLQLASMDAAGENSQEIQTRSHVAVYLI